MTKFTTKFKLFGCCFLVLGHKRALICDIQRRKFSFIPLALYEILKKYNGKDINEIKKIFKSKYDVIIDEYFEFLESEEFIFYTDTPNLFPNINLDWEQPYQATNALIDLNSKSDYIDWNSVISQFEELGIKHFQLRCFSKQPFSFFDTLLDICKNSRISSIEIITPFSLDYEMQSIIDFCECNPRISSLYFYSAPVDEMIYTNSTGKGNIINISQPITSSNHCGIISPEYFSINIKTFTESQHHNTCLNRKISIDVEGNIKNCPSMAQSFGNIRDTTLQEALAHPDFKKYWNITKDKISVCKDCEFRHICTDCRAYIEDPNDDFSKPLKCGYNPYTCEWEEWSTHPMKQKAITHYQFF